MEAERWNNVGEGGKSCCGRGDAEEGDRHLKNKPKPLGLNMFEETDRIIVMGCEAEGFCPASLLDKVEDWYLEDPNGKPLEEIRMIRDQIESKLIDEIWKQKLDFKLCMCLAIVCQKPKKWV